MSTPSHDDQLRRALRERWTAPAQADPGFRAAVWARIEAGRRLPATWAGWLKINLGRVTACALLGVVLAGAGGGWLAADQAKRDREQLIRRYVVSIDPHQHMGGALQFDR